MFLWIITTDFLFGHGLVVLLVDVIAALEEEIIEFDIVPRGEFLIKTLKLSFLTTVLFLYTLLSCDGILVVNESRSAKSLAFHLNLFVGKTSPSVSYILTRSAVCLVCPDPVI